jgi:hypothetical protein
VICNNHDMLLFLQFLLAVFLGGWICFCHKVYGRKVSHLVDSLEGYIGPLTWYTYISFLTPDDGADPVLRSLCVRRCKVMDSDQNTLFIWNKGDLKFETAALREHKKWKVFIWFRLCWWF